MICASNLRLPKRAEVTLGLSLLIASILVVLTGCGSESDSSDQPKESQATETVGEDVATVEQYASIVAKRQMKSISSTEDCKWLGTGNLDREPGSIVCNIGLLSLATEASLLRLELTGASDEESGLYIGAAPEEIETLIDDTVEASSALNRAAKQANKSDCGLTGTGVCSSLRIDVVMASGDLSSELDAWAPYL